MDLKESATLKNLMRAFSGETQAWARYTFAAAAARNQGFPALERLFRYTAEQEKEHAEILWKLLQSGGVGTVPSPGDYPVDLQTEMLSLLRRAAEHERSEAGEVYPAFAKTADGEGFPDIALRFRQLADIERLHGQRFQSFADALTQGTLFRSESPVQWICLNCGHVYTGAEPPASCPVCAHEKGYFVPMELSPFQ